MGKKLLFKNLSYRSHLQDEDYVNLLRMDHPLGHMNEAINVLLQVIKSSEV